MVKEESIKKPQKDEAKPASSQPQVAKRPVGGKQEETNEGNQVDYSEMSVPTLQEKQKALIEEFNQCSYQMNNNQHAIEQIMQVTQQMQQLYNQHQEMLD